MKKIININLSGRVIPIEDAAYETLQRYIESLRRYFSNEEGRDEIINDIESRVAELMNDKIRKGATAVTEADMDEIIGAMGRVEDFEPIEGKEAFDSTSAGGNSSSDAPFMNIKMKKGRLYRDRNDKFLGGVCAGIASYMNVDPTIIRLLFAIITFGGFGTGFFIYILLWIILPASDIESVGGKRLFRNPEDKIIGGVASGLSAYFGKSPTTARLIFAAPLILSIFFSVFDGLFNAWHGPDFGDLIFSSFTGTFVLAYIVLWIVLPEAKSPYQKMEMRGNKVDVNSIKQNVQQNMADLGTKAQAWGEEVRERAESLGKQAGSFASNRGRSFATEVGQTARPVASGLGRAIGILFKAFFLFITGVIAFALFIAVIALTTSGVIGPVNDFVLNGFWQKASLWGTLLLFIGVPVVAFIVWLVRRLMRVRSQNRYLGWTFGGLWTLGWISLFLFVSLMGRDFKYYSKTETAVPLTTAPVNKMLVRIDEPRLEYSGSFDWINDEGDGGGWDLTNDSLKLSLVRIKIVKSADSNYHVNLLRYSGGRTRKEAQARAERFDYNINSADSTLILGSGFSLGKPEKFRGQRAVVEIEVPVGKQIRLDESVADKLELNNVRIRINEGDRWDRRWGRDRNRWDRNWDRDYDNYFDWSPNVDYVMTESGEPVEVGSNRSNKKVTVETNDNDVYEYRSGNDSTNRNQEYQNDQRRREAEQRKREMEERKRRLQQEMDQLEEESKKMEDGGTAKSSNLKDAFGTTHTLMGLIL